MTSKLSACLQLTKPEIMLLVLVTGATGLVMEGHFLARPLDFGLVMLALFLTGGSANALNQYFEREIDARMSRTRRRRPLPMGRLTPNEALGFAVGIGVAGVVLLAWRFNLLSAALGLGTILFYGLLYTLLLKPHTAQNIVIGGAAGAMAPVIAWAAAAGNLALTPWLLFLVIFLWTPPHFWALALYYQDDYREVKLPMMPVVAGELSTLRQMFGYSILLVLVSFALLFYAGWLYGVVAVVLGAWFLHRCLVALRTRARQAEFALFKFSIVYLFALFGALIVEGLAGWQ